MIRSLLTTITVGLLVPAVAACGGDGDSDSNAATTATVPATNESSVAAGDSGGTATAATSAPNTPRPTVASSQPSTGDGAGSVAIDGVVTVIDEVHRCEPFFDSEDGLDLTGIGDGVMVFVTVNQPISGVGFTMFEVSIQGGKAGGIFSGMASSLDGSTWTNELDEPLAGKPYERTDDRVSGTLEVVEARVGDEVRTVTVDLEIPSEIVDC